MTTFSIRGIRRICMFLCLGFVTVIGFLSGFDIEFLSYANGAPRELLYGSLLGMFFLIVSRGGIISMLMIEHYRHKGELGYFNKELYEFRKLKIGCYFLVFFGYIAICGNMEGAPEAVIEEQRFLLLWFTICQTVGLSVLYYIERKLVMEWTYDIRSTIACTRDTRTIVDIYREFAKKN